MSDYIPPPPSPFLANNDDTAPRDIGTIIGWEQHLHIPREQMVKAMAGYGNLPPVDYEEHNFFGLKDVVYDVDLTLIGEWKWRSVLSHATADQLKRFLVLINFTVCDWGLIPEESNIEDAQKGHAVYRVVTPVVSYTPNQFGESLIVYLEYHLYQLRFSWRHPLVEDRRGDLIDELKADLRRQSLTHMDQVALMEQSHFAELRKERERFQREIASLKKRCSQLDEMISRHLNQERSWSEILSEVQVDQSSPSGVYVIQNISRPSEYKIGKGRPVKDRISNLGTEFPFSIAPIVVIRTPNESRLERYLHKRYKDKRIRDPETNRARGEWFLLSPDDLTELRYLSTAPERVPA